MRLAWRDHVVVTRAHAALSVCLQCGARAAHSRQLEGSACRHVAALPRSVVGARLGGVLDSAVWAAGPQAEACARALGWRPLRAWRNPAARAATLRARA